MKDHLNIICFLNDKRKKQINALTFDAKSCILGANAKTFCFQTNHMSEWNSYFFRKLFSRFLKAPRVHFHCCWLWSGFEIFSPGKQRKGECLKSKMAEKYTLSITMIVYQIEKVYQALVPIEIFSLPAVEADKDKANDTIEKRGNLNEDNGHLCTGFVKQTEDGKNS
jgi:hypothetical protein